MIEKRTVLACCVIVLALSCSRERPEQNNPGSSPSVSSPSAPPLEGVAVGSQMPPYTAVLVGGERFDVAQLRGEVVLLNVWATWCGPCRYEIPTLKALHDKYRAQKFQVVGVSVDEKDFQEDVKKYVQGEKVQYPIVLDPEGKIGSLFHISVLPTSMLLDREGKIVWIQTGMIVEGDQSLESAIQKVL